MLSAERQSAQTQLNPVWHRMLYSCNHMATVDIKVLMNAGQLMRPKHSLELHIYTVDKDNAVT